MAAYGVNLPQTNFPMKANLSTREPKILEFWHSIDLYKKCENLKNSRGKFTVHDGPPYANGDIHLGHAFNKILKDIVNKSKLLAGYSINYVPGWDCHGLPIELNVEKKHGKAGANISIDKFIETCRSYAAQQIQIQMAGFKRLGVLGDWDNFYSTMDFKYEANIVRSLMKIIDSGYLVRGCKAVHWCTACGSALAEAEVEYQTIVSPAIDVRFNVINPEKFSITNLSIPIWTTTPWTLPANEAVAVNPDFKYVLVNCITLGEHLIVAEKLLTSTMDRYGENNYHTVASYLGRDLIDLKLRHPFLMEKIVPLILGNHVTLDMGTGAVHTAPAHGADDHALGLKYQLPLNNPVGPDGNFLATVDFFAGQNIFAANPQVIALLKEKKKLIHETKLEHSYPHCWRHKTKLIFSTTKQWFIGMDKIGTAHGTLRSQALNAIEDITWVPSQGKRNMQNMVASRPDWCISRQRFWGLPITLFIHRETEKIHPEMARFVEEIIAPKIEKEGLTYWHNLDHREFLEKHATEVAEIEDYIKVTDSLDVWFNSGVSHHCIANAQKSTQFPADLYIEGSDQYRGWFQSSLLTALALNGKAPYKGIITHGFCVDSNGHKMSKSLGNIISPKSIIDKYGADILRLWVGSTYMHGDLAASDEIFLRTTDFYRTLRNTARFLLGNLFDFNPERDLVASDQMLSLDRFAVSQFLALVATMEQHYENYQFHLALNLLQTKLTNEVSSFYFSIIKDRLYTMAPNSLGRRSAQSALFHMLELLVRIISPILSFTAEEIWQEMRALDDINDVVGRSESVFISDGNKLPRKDNFDLTADAITSADWEQIQNYRAVVNKALEQLRSNGIIGSSLEADVTLFLDDSASSSLVKLSNDLHFIFITSTAVISTISLAPGEAIATEISGLKLLVTKSPHKKCSRCWHHVEDVGINHEHPELCSRCISNLFGEGEIRRV